MKKVQGQVQTLARERERERVCFLGIRKREKDGKNVRVAQTHTASARFSWDVRLKKTDLDYSLSGNKICN